MKHIYAIGLILAAINLITTAQAQQWDLRLESAQYAVVTHEDPLKPVITPAGDKASENIVLVFTATPLTKQEWKERILVEIGRVPDVAISGAGYLDGIGSQVVWEKVQTASTNQDWMIWIGGIPRKDGVYLDAPVGTVIQPGKKFTLRFGYRLPTLGNTLGSERPKIIIKTAGYEDVETVLPSLDLNKNMQRPNKDAQK